LTRYMIQSVNHEQINLKSTNTHLSLFIGLPFLLRFVYYPIVRLFTIGVLLKTIRLCRGARSLLGVWGQVYRLAVQTVPRSQVTAWRVRAGLSSGCPDCSPWCCPDSGVPSCTTQPGPRCQSGCCRKRCYSAKTTHYVRRWVRVRWKNC
jgi:hypothetical protein